MKLLALTAILFIASPLCAADLSSSSSCARTLLTQAFEHIKEKHASEGIALYIQVRDHPNAEVWMILQASIELKSHHMREDAISGFHRIIARDDTSESQLLHVGKMLLELGEFDAATLAFDKVLAQPIVSSNTRRYIQQLCTSAPK